VEYSTDLFDVDDIRHLVDVFGVVAVSVAHGPDTRVLEQLDKARHRVEERT
jgi:hypothetical protein